MPGIGAENNVNSDHVRTYPIYFVACNSELFEHIYRFYNTPGHTHRTSHHMPWGLHIHSHQMFLSAVCFALSRGETMADESPEGQNGGPDTGKGTHVVEQQQQPVASPARSTESETQGCVGL